MKDKPLLYLSLLISVASLAYAAWVRAQIGNLVDRAVKQREEQIVHRWAPKMREVYRDMLEGKGEDPKNANTLEELFDPLFTLLQSAGELSKDAKPEKEPKK